MKKFILLSILFFSLTLMSFECAPEIVDIDVEPSITANDLVGDWKFSNLDFNNKSATELSAEKYYWITLNINFLSNDTAIIVTSDFVTKTNKPIRRKYVINGNELIFPQIGIYFDCKLENKNTLILTHTKNTGGMSRTPVGGTYTLRK